MSTDRPADPEALAPQHPWPGLRPFTEEDKSFFFGREREVDLLLAMVMRNPVVVLYGQSGLGKTSMLRAGLFPRLKGLERVPVWVRLDHAESGQALARQILQSVHQGLSEQGVEAPAPRDDDSLWSYFHRRDTEFWGARNRLVQPVVVLDQFEEAFTLGAQNAATRQRTEALVAELECQFEQRPPAAVRERLDRQPEDAAEYELGREGVSFVISLREDYLPHLDAWRRRIPTLLLQRLRLEQMSAAQAMEVVVRAGAEVIEPDVAEEVVAFVAGDPLGGETGQRRLDGRVEPAILSVVCDELNRRRESAGLAKITAELLSGERTRIVEEFYERSFDGIPDAVRDWVEDELLTASGHRDRAALEDARTQGVDIEALQNLVQRRVLHSDERHGVVWVELTHDLLTGPAMASRTVRAARRAEADAEAKARTVREQLSRARRLNLVFGAMCVVMALGGVYLYLARKWTEEAHMALAASEQRAQGNARNAVRQTDMAQAAAAQAELAAQDARAQAELAKASLELARQTAIKLARQGLESLETEWGQPAYGAAALVGSVNRQLDALLPSFGEVPEMQQVAMQTAALSALVLADLGEEQGCTEQMARGGSFSAEIGDRESAVAQALMQLAIGRCKQLRGDDAGSEAAQRRTIELARGLPPAMSHRITVEAMLSLAGTYALRYDNKAVREVVGRLQARIDAAGSVLPKTETKLWKADTLLVLASLDDPNLRQEESLNQFKALVDSLDPNETDQLRWRLRVADGELSWAYRCWETGDYFAAQDHGDRAVQRYDQLINAQPDAPPAWRLERLSAFRMQMQLAFAMGLQAEGESDFAVIQKESQALMGRVPRLARARYQVGAAQWTAFGNTKLDDDAKRKGLLTAERTLQQLRKDAPGLAGAVRGQAIVERDLGRLALNQSNDTRRSTDERSALRAEAEQRFDRAIALMHTLDPVSATATVADITAGLELYKTDVADARKDVAASRQAFERAAAEYRKVPLTGANRSTRTLLIAHPGLFLSRFARLAKDFDAADRIDAEGLGLLAKAVKESPGDVELFQKLAWIHVMAAGDQLNAGQLELAVNNHAESIAALARGIDAGPLNPQVQKEMDDAVEWRKKYLRPRLEEVRDGKRQAPGTDVQQLLKKLDELDRMANEAGKVAAVPVRAWSPSPPFQGKWQTLRADDVAASEPRLAPLIEKLAQAGWATQGARKTSLPFYRSTSVIELLVRAKDGEEGATLYLVGPKGEPMAVNGQPGVIAEFNKTNLPDLRLEQNAVQYLRFLFSTFRSGSGVLRLLDDRRDLLWEEGTSDEQRRDLVQRLAPLQIVQADHGNWAAGATLQLGESVMYIKIKLRRDGLLDFFKGYEVKPDRYLATEHFVDGIRVRRKASAIALNVRRLADAKDWKGAALAQESLMADVGRSLLDANERKSELSDKFTRLGWYRLLAGDTQDSLRASDAGLTMDPANLGQQINKAHALLLLGRDAEAEAAYTANIGKPTYGPGSRIWELEIENDFKQLEAAGIKHPGFARIRQLLAQAAARPAGSGHAHIVDPITPSSR